MTPVDPVHYPTVTLGAKKYEIRFSAASVVELKKKHQIDLMSGEGITFRGAEALEQAAVLVSYGVAHTVKITPEDILGMVDLTEWADLFVAIQESQKKASDRARTVIKLAQDEGRIAKPEPRPESPTPVTVQ